MNRLPRRPPRPQPPLRGRAAAAIPPLGQEPCVRPMVRQRPPTSGGLASRTSSATTCDGLHPSFLAFYRQWPILFKVLDRPWKWVAAVILLVLLSLLVGARIHS